MKRIYIPLALLLVTLLLTATACNENTPPAESDTTPATESATDAPTEPETDPVTEPETDAPTDPVTEPQQTETEPETDPPRKYREDWAEDDPENPYYNLIPVGTSYDGKTTCYDGRYDFGFDIARAGDGTTFTSMQDAIDYYDGVGGAISITTSLDICLQLYIPDDEMSYRIFYNCHNVDFVFNRGIIYDDCKPNEEGIRGFCYYSDLYVLDSIGGLQDTYVWVLASFEQLEPGRYVMIDEFVEEDDWYFVYNYEKTSDINVWYGLPHGEKLPE